MKLTASNGDAPPTEFECFDNWLSEWISSAVLAGQNYPQLPGIEGISTIVDVGANCGAASVYFARCYPDATIHALEPAGAPFALLERNAQPYPNIRPHNVGLYSSDRTAPLYEGVWDAGTASIFRRPGKNREASEEITLREARSWLREQRIDSIDLLKIDVEGAEFDVLENIADMLPRVRVLYAEYDSIEARRQIDDLLIPTHDLVHGIMYLDQGEVIYVARELLADPKPIIQFFRRRVGESFEAHAQRSSHASGDG